MSTQSKKWLVFKKWLPAIILIATILLTIGIYSLWNVNTQHVPVNDEVQDVCIRITSDGTIEGTDKICKNGNIYTLIEDIAGDVDVHSVFISIECDGIIFDGAGKTIRGTNGKGEAIKLYEVSNVTIKNTRIINFETGIYSRNSQKVVSDIKIVDNYFENSFWVAITSYKIEGFTISGNTFLKCNPILADATTGITFTNNALIDCGIVYVPDGLDVFYDNTVNGKPLVLLEDQSNQVIDNAGQVILINCTNMIIQNIDEQDLTSAIQLFGTNNTLITNCKSDITLTNSNNNTITSNEISVAKYVTPLWLINSNNNTIINNKLSVVNQCAMFIEMSSSNSIAQNLIYGDGIVLRDDSEYNKIENNTILAITSIVV
jgi:hypothetical protein